MKEFSLVIHDVKWTYAPLPSRLAWVRAESSLRYRFPVEAKTAEEAQRVVDVMRQYEEYHKPKLHRRVMYVNGLYVARHEKLPGFVFGFSPSHARESARIQRSVDHIPATDEVLAVLAALRAQPDEEVLPGE